MKLPNTYGGVEKSIVMANLERDEDPEDHFPPEANSEPADIVNYPSVKDDQQPDGDGSWNVMDHLEQALNSGSAPVKDEAGGSGAQPEAPPPRLDPSTEDILAALGVSGSPKPVYPTTGPGYVGPRTGPPLHEAQPVTSPPVKQEGYQQSYPHTPTGCQQPAQAGYQQPYPNHQQQYPPPPPPQRQRSPSFDPWKADQLPNGRNSPDRPVSRGSNGTQPGGDFDEPMQISQAEAGAQIPPGLFRMESENARKRSLPEPESSERQRQEDDTMYKKRKSQPSVNSAYR